LDWAGAFSQPVAYKCEFLQPTGSYKDRGTATLESILRSREAKSAVEDSSGNAGASFAAYAARAGIHARVFIPDSASGPKQAQIEAYGVELVRVPGARSNAGEAALQAVEQPGSAMVYASHAYLPFNLPGYATLAYELAEQLGGAPGSLILPVGQGGLLLGAWRGFTALREAGIIEKLPVLVGVQARLCAPLWAISMYGMAGAGWVAEGRTLAEGIRIIHPVRGDAVLQAVAESGGQFLAVDEEQIRSGQESLARLGLFVEPTSAVVWDALDQAAGGLPKPIVVVLTGSGYKSEL
jgi:threonine synthase